MQYRILLTYQWCTVAIKTCKYWKSHPKKHEIFNSVAPCDNIYVQIAFIITRWQCCTDQQACVFRPKDSQMSQQTETIFQNMD